MLERVRQILIKEFIQVLRDPRMGGVVFVMPVVQMLIFGYVATTDVRNVRLAVYDLDNTVDSRALVDDFTKSGYFRIVSYAAREADVRDLLDHGTVNAVLRVDRGYAEDLRSGRTARVQMLLDGTDSNTARIVLGYSAGIIEGLSRRTLVSLLSHTRGDIPQLFPVDLDARAWFNENLESRNFYVPGVVVLIVTITTLVLTSMAIVREKEIGTIEQIMVTPIKSVEFILGKTVPFAIIAFIDVTIVTTVGVLWFHVPVRGSLLFLFLATALYLTTTLGLGLLISTISQTQQQAMMSSFLFNFPAMLLSGFIFPIANMPASIRWLAYLIPLSYFMTIVRGVFLKGTGPATLWPELLVLAVMGPVTLALATRLFRKTFT